MRKLVVGLGLLVIALTGCQSTQQDTAAGTMNMQPETELAPCDIFLVMDGKDCAMPNPESLAQFPLGSAENPVRAWGPGGQREYLSRLICANHEHPLSFKRIGNVGEGPYGTYVDLYEVICETSGGEQTISVHMDMYHQHRETYPAAGFIDIGL